MSQQKPTSLPPYYAAKNLSRQLQIIKRASGVGSALSITENPNNLTLESWLKRHEVYSTSIPPVDSRLADFNVIEVQSQFLDCATVIYTLQVGFPAHPDYPRLSEDPQVQNTLDMTARWYFERLKVLRLEILKRMPVTDPTDQLETAWNGLIRHLRLESEAESIAKKDAQSLPGKSNFQAYTDLGVPGIIPDEPPSPRSYWIDLHPIEDARHESGSIPEDGPTPLSYRIDLRPITDCEGLIPEVAPEPTSMFLELHPLDNSSAADNGHPRQR